MSIPLPTCYRLFSNETSNNTPDRDDEKDSEYSAEIRTVKVDDLYLNADERFEIFIVKSAERPHLLSYDPLQELAQHDDLLIEEMEEKKNELLDDGNGDIAPLIDGCDLPGWRKENIVMHHKYEYNDKPYSKTLNSEIQSLQSLLNIGPSSTMFRRETQWPNINKLLELSNRPWKEFKARLLQEPAGSAIVVQYDDCCQLVKIDEKTYGSQKDNDYNCNTGRMVTRFAVEFEQRNIPAKIMGATEGWECMPKGDNKFGERLWT